MRFRNILVVISMTLFTACSGVATRPGLSSELSGTRTTEVYDVADILAQVVIICCVPIHVHNGQDETSGMNPFGFSEDPCDEAEGFDMSELIDLVVESTGGYESWEKTESTIVPRDKELLVNATPALRLAVRSFLKKLREPQN